MNADDDPIDASRYPGEDTRSTSRQELAGWYSYGWAAEVFVVCGISEFLIHPLLHSMGASGFPVE